MSTPDIVIRNGTIVDGTGAPPRPGEIAITDGVITEVADKIDGSGTREIDADGRIVTPGFVDIHTHLDAQMRGTPSRPRVAGMASPAQSSATVVSRSHPSLPVALTSSPR